MRILAEFLEPLAHFRREKMRDTVVFFGSARLTRRRAAGAILRRRAHAGAHADRVGGAVHQQHVPVRGLLGRRAGHHGSGQPRRLRRDGKTVGLNIGLPFEQFPNPYITPELSFEFHYFFMRKFWFAYLAKALVVFPGGFGTLDELMEILTLTQTQKLAKKMTIVLYGSKYWKEIINFDALVKYGMISPEDLNLFQYADDPQTAFEMLKTALMTYALQPETPETPAISKSRNPQKPAGTA